MPSSDLDGLALPHLTTAIPGPHSVRAVDVLARHECPAITSRRARRAASLGLADADPIVWDRALGANVWDADGNRFVDLTSGFGVALVGHRNPAVVAAAHAQTDRLLHAMGDTYPDLRRIELLDRLAQIAPEGLEHSILGLSGSDAIDAMVKTAVLATGRTGVLVFTGSYHGLSLGAVALQQYKAAFTEPFARIVHPEVHALPYGCSPAQVREAVRQHRIGLVLVEPIQGRGGMIPAPDGWLEELAEAARAEGALFGADEIQCGMGRTGEIWASPVAPDLLAVGKALAGGFPLSACLGTEQAMGAWGASVGEALHTQTFLGHPVGCAAALAVIDQLPAVLEQVRRTSAYLVERLHQQGWTTRGRGLMIGLHHPSSVRAMQQLLGQGWLVLPAGTQAEVLGLTPPAVLCEAQIDGFVAALEPTR